jgi:hypothetical protein
VLIPEESNFLLNPAHADFASWRARSVALGQAQELTRWRQEGQTRLVFCALVPWGRQLPGYR